MFAAGDGLLPPTTFSDEMSKIVVIKRLGSEGEERPEFAGARGELNAISSRSRRISARRVRSGGLDQQTGALTLEILAAC